MCIVSINGELKRLCFVELKDGDVIDMFLLDVKKVQVIGMDKILYNYEFYCIVCDYNNGGCEIYNMVKEMKINY